MPKMNVIKSIYVDAAPEKIYPIINDLSNWEQWSPWVIAEPNAQLNVAADGKYHEWDGEIIGAGNLKIKKEVENQSVTMAKKGVGSLAYNDRWHLFDQMLFSLNWYNDPSLFLLKTAVYSPSKLRTLRGRYQGYPFRTVIRGNTLEGYSDHFPVYTILGEKKD